MSGVFLNLSGAAPARARIHPTFTIRVTSDVVPAPPKRAESEPRQILRFQRSERLLHWSIAIPFMVCYTTAVILFLFFNLRTPGYALGSIQSPCSTQTMFMRVSARLHASAAPDAPAPMINTSAGSCDIPYRSSCAAWLAQSTAGSRTRASH